MFTLFNLSCAYYSLVILFSVVILKMAVHPRGADNLSFGKMEKVQVLSAAGVIILSLYYFIKKENLCGEYVADMSFVLVPLFLSRSAEKYDRIRLGLPYAILATGVILLIISFFRPVGNDWNRGFLLPLPLLCVTGLLMKFIWDTTAKDRETVPSTRPEERLSEFADFIQFCALMLIFCVGALVRRVSEVRGVICAIVCTLALGMLVVCHFIRLKRGSIFVFNRKREQDFLQRQKPKSKSIPLSDMNRRLCDIFDKLLDFFHQEKPFLNPDLSIVSVSKSLLTNKLYVSRSINLRTGISFPQFVNFCRVKYAVEQFNDNKDYGIAELARISGFRTTHSFSTAFRLYTGISPREWCRMNKYDNPTDASLKEIAESRLEEWWNKTPQESGTGADAGNQRP